LGEAKVTLLGTKLVPARVDRPEWLDLGVGSLADVRASFVDIWRINRYLGGLIPLHRYLYPRLRQHPGSVADIGAGSGHIAIAIARWTKQEQLPVTVTALDIAPRNLAIAQTLTQDVSNIHLIQADAITLPLAPKSVDYVISSLFLHHLTPEQVVTFLRSSFGVARHALIMSDLVRGWLPMVGFKLSQPIFARHPMTRYDGMVSIRRAYTPRELKEFAKEAGIRHFRIETHWAWRMTLVADK
jgi:SAM-dependent methyltransferase